VYSSTFTYIAGEFDDEFYELDNKIAEAARSIVGYLGEETWENKETGKVSNIYFWDSLESLQKLIQDPNHIIAKQKSTKWLESYHVTLSKVAKTYGNKNIGFNQTTDETPTPRLATHEDLTSLAKIFNDYRVFYEQEENIEHATRFISARLKNQDSIILLSCDEHNRIYGFCQIYPTFCSVIADKIYILSDLYVDPTTRKCGIGKSLLLAAENLARQNGISRMDLTTARTNSRAQSLYESLGWTRDSVFIAYNRTIVKCC
jgi:ribosomal protein S18 acetylase RimI-like enzyme